MKKLIYGSLFLLPVLAGAQVLGGVLPLINTIQSFLQPILRILFGLAIIYFFWGVAKYVLAAGDAKKAEEGRSIMIYGIIAIAVMASVYGLVNLLQTIFGVGGGTVTVPPLP